MTERVFLHPGPLKTGTTYLQSLLYANRKSFLDQGITIVGNQASHYRAANELIGKKSLRASHVPRGAWKRTRKAVLRAPGDAVMSCERYSLFRVKHARRVLEDLAAREVHVVLTLRDPVAVLPARWQEGIKNGGIATWTQFQERIADDPDKMQKMTRAIPTLRTWAKVLPPERIHVVTVPPKGAPRTLLLERFCEAIGADPAGLETLETERANPSMDFVTTELLRRVNTQDAVKLSGHAQHFEIKSFLAAELPTRSYRPELSGTVLEIAKSEAQALMQRIEAGGFEVVGDLNDLVSSTSTAPTGLGVEVNPEELLDTAAVAIAALAQRSWERGNRAGSDDELHQQPKARRFFRARWRRRSG